MLASIIILILFLPAAFLPLALDTFASSADLDEMGISLESSDDTFPMQGYELVGFKHCNKWEVNKPLQACR